MTVTTDIGTHEEITLTLAANSLLLCQLLRGTAITSAAMHVNSAVRNLNKTINGTQITTTVDSIAKLAESISELDYQRAELHQQSFFATEINKKALNCIIEMHALCERLLGDQGHRVYGHDEEQEQTKAAA